MLDHAKATPIPKTPLATPEAQMKKLPCFRTEELREDWASESHTCAPCAASDSQKQ